MTDDILKGKWEQLKGEAQKQWGKLTDDQLDQIEGDRKKFIGTLQECYGITKEKAQKEIEDWEDKLAA